MLFVCSGGLKRLVVQHYFDTGHVVDISWYSGENADASVHIYWAQDGFWNTHQHKADIAKDKSLNATVWNHEPQDFQKVVNRSGINKLRPNTIVD